jgi:hypothetical protein
MIVGSADLHTAQLLWTGATAGAFGMHLGQALKRRLTN